ncbi:MAG TPA: hypothetical protein PKH50_02925 [bacterium]|jgi:hypothetical protein|nr:hypothetical protein [bacterium]
MKKDQQAGKIEGGQVFIFSKDIKNDGQIISSGIGAKTHIETETYTGRGSVESHEMTVNEQKWFKKHFREIVVGIVCTVVGGLILYYLFGIK